MSRALTSYPIDAPTVAIPVYRPPSRVGSAARTAAVLIVGWVMAALFALLLLGALLELFPGLLL